MRLLAWNCRGGPFDAKLRAVARLKPDVAVISELPKPPADFPLPHIWHGERKSKGVAVIARAGTELRLACRPSSLSRHAIPVIATRGEFSMLIVAVWAQGGGDDRYVRGVVDALRSWSRLLKRLPSIVIGDTNSNTFWDDDNPRDRNHSALVRFLGRRSIVSAYHAIHDEPHGSETRPTFFLYNHANRPYHLDYCFVPSAWLSPASRCLVGEHRQWSAWSDHRPVIVDDVGPA